MTGARTIGSLFSLINSAGRILASEASRSAARASHDRLVHLRDGEVRRLPPGLRYQLVSGHLWLTHEGDDRDHFPLAGTFFETTTDTVVEAFAESVLRVTP